MKKKLLFVARAWIIWGLAALFMFYKYALEVSPSVMTGTLMSAFQISGVDLGNLAASYFYAYLLLQIPAGVLLDRFGPRKMTSLAITVCALGNLVFAQAPSLWVAEVGRFFVGAGAAFAAVTCLKLTANWFPSSRFAFMAGLMMTIAMLGAVGGQAPLSYFISQLEWRSAMNWIGGAGLVFAVIFWLVIRDVSPSHAIEKVFAPAKVSILKNLKKLFKSSQSWWLSIYSGFAFAPVMVFGGLWGVSFLSEAYQISQHLSAQYVSLIFVGFGLGAPLFGYLSDQWKKRKPLMYWGSSLSLVMITLIVYVPMGCMVPCALFGFGFFISSFLLCFTMIREINTPIMAATAIGFMNAFDALFGAFSDPLTGKILDMQWSGTILNGARIFSVSAYKIAFLTLPIYLAIAILALIPIKETHCKPTIPSSLP